MSSTTTTDSTATPEMEAGSSAGASAAPGAAGSDSSSRTEAALRTAPGATDAAAPEAAGLRGRLRGISSRRQHGRNRRIPAWASVLICLAVAVLLEVFAFNFRHWQSLGYEPVVLRDTSITITSADYSVGLGSMDLDVKNLQIVVSGPNDNSSIWITVAVSDEGESQIYELPVTQSHQNNERSMVHTIFAYGNVKSMRLTVVGDAYGGVDGDILLGSNSLPITIERVVANVTVPLYFSSLRLVLTVIAVLMVWFLWPAPGRLLARIPALSGRPGPVVARTCVLVGSMVLLTAFWLAIPKWTGIATPFYNASKYSASLGGVVQLTGQPDTATNEYGKLAQSFAAGQIDLLQQPPQWLIDMDDPYMYQTRTRESAQQIRGYLWDTAYYDGHYYVYFGVLPALVYYLPFWLLTGEYFPNGVAVLISSLLFVGGWYALLRALIRYKFRKASLGSFFLVFLGVLFCSGLLFGLGRAGLYNVPVTSGRALVVWGLYLLYVGWHKRSPGRLAAGSFLLACIAATRPQLLIVAPLFLVPLVWVLRQRAPEFPRRRKVDWLLSLLLPMLVVAAAVMWYNWARFDSPFDFGAAYNLTYNNMTMRGHSVMRMLDGLYYSLFNPPTVTSAFPFISRAAVYPSFEGITIYEPLMGGLVWLNPMLLAIFLIFGLAKKKDRDIPVFLYSAYFAGAGLILVAFDADGAGILLRYFQDFGFLFGLSAALIFLHHLAGRGAHLPAAYELYAEKTNRAAAPLVPVAELPAGAAEGLSREVDASGAAAASDRTQQSLHHSVHLGLRPGLRSRLRSRHIFRRKGAVVENALAAVENLTSVLEEQDSHYAAALEQTGSTSCWDEEDAQCTRRPAWAVALYVAVLLGFVMSVLAMLFMMNPIEGGVSGGGTYPEFWEAMRQTFQFWL